MSCIVALQPPYNDSQPTNRNGEGSTVVRVGRPVVKQVSKLTVLEDNVHIH